MAFAPWPLVAIRSRCATSRTDPSRPRVRIGCSASRRRRTRRRTGACCARPGARWRSAGSSNGPAGKEAAMLEGFKKFILRGNVMDLAVAVVIGAAFGAVVTSFVTHILTPLIAAVVGKPDFSALVLTINKSEIKIGMFLNALISFLLVATAVYFGIVAPLNSWNERRMRGQAPADPTTKTCPECTSVIPIAARRCPQSTAPLTAAR